MLSSIHFADAIRFWNPIDEAQEVVLETGQPLHKVEQLTLEKKFVRDPPIQDENTLSLQVGKKEIVTLGFYSQPE